MFFFFFIKTCILFYYLHDTKVKIEMWGEYVCFPSFNLAENILIIKISF